MKAHAVTFAGLLLASTPARADPPAQDVDLRGLRTCLARSIDPFHADRCHAAYIEGREMRLANALAAARQVLDRRFRETNRGDGGALADDRRDPAFLDRAQAAWRTFVEQDCTMRAGLLRDGPWIGRAARDCYAEALNRRISFLDQVARGALAEP